MSQTVSFSLQPEVQLRFLNPNDIDEVKTLCQDWFPIEYPDSWFQEITSNAKFYSLAATYDCRIIGLIVCEVKSRTKCNKEDADLLSSNSSSGVHVAYILSLGVLKDFRRQGIASLLLDSLVSYLTTNEQHNCRVVYLHVLTTNAAAIRFYEQRNFKMHNYLPYYYSIKGKPRDGYTYALYINGGQPPWTLLDYIKHVGHLLSKLQPCTLPQRLLRSAQSMWKIVTGKSQIPVDNNHDS
ncbi:N-alpha-acetyltransferase 60-like [Lineus longissimus]|uniref:N-alpha-acetyltransferase 60-like n=1 Tax=Lineus longissimus TaxID=88925 RepID=UPI002B4D63CA